MASCRLGGILCVGGIYIIVKSFCENSYEKVESAILKAAGLSAYYKDNQVVKDLNLSV